MKAVFPLVIVLAIALAAFFGGQVEPVRTLLGVWIPYAAIAIFLVGFAWRVIRWSRSPVPFRIPVTCGQQKSLAFLKPSRLDNPSTTLGVLGRMALEVLLFRSLFRNNRVELHRGAKLAYGEDKLLWLGALVFHWSYMVIFLRHLRFFMEPVPAFVVALENVDGFFQVGAPVIYWSGLLALVALGYLLSRRLMNPQVRYISLPADYLAVYLLMGLMLTGIIMRYFTRADILSVKRLAMGLVTLSPVVPPEVGPLFLAHLTLMSVLIAYFPFSKLMHMPGIFLSPTRNLANNNRSRRHINPWNYPVNIHTYQEWEDEFHDKIVAAGLPLDKE